jgi:hypothetical protein
MGRARRHRPAFAGAGPSRQGPGVREEARSGRFERSRAATRGGSPRRPLLCFSHLRWNFVYQRPQHLLTRCARDQKVYSFEEPHFTETTPRLEVTPTASGVTVVVPHLTPGLVIGARPCGDSSYGRTSMQASNGAWPT